MSSDVDFTASSDVWTGSTSEFTIYLESMGIQNGIGALSLGVWDSGVSSGVNLK